MLLTKLKKACYVLYKYLSFKPITAFVLAMQGSDAMVSFRTDVSVCHKQYKATWDIKHHMVVCLEGVEFVRIDGTCLRAMKALAFEDNALTPSPKPVHFSMNMCNGYTWLREARNEHLKNALKLRAKVEAQEAADAANKEAGRTKRLEEEPAADENIAPRLSYDEIKEMRSRSKVELIDIEVTCIAQTSDTDDRIIQVEMPVLPNDTIKVLMNVKSIDVFIRLVRESGFTLENSKSQVDQKIQFAKRHPTLESIDAKKFGLQRDGSKYKVVVKDKGSKRSFNGSKSKRCANIDDAIAELAQVANAPMDVADEEMDDGDGDDAASGQDPGESEVNTSHGGNGVEDTNACVHARVCVHLLEPPRAID